MDVLYAYLQIVHKTNPVLIPHLTTNAKQHLQSFLCYYQTKIASIHIKSAFAITEHNTPLIHTSVLKTLHNHQTLNNAYTEILTGSYQSYI